MDDLRTRIGSRAYTLRFGKTERLLEDEPIRRVYLRSLVVIASLEPSNHRSLSHLALAAIADYRNCLIIHD